MHAEWQAKVYRKPKRIGGENRGPITLQLESRGQNRDRYLVPVLTGKSSIVAF